MRIFQVHWDDAWVDTKDVAIAEAKEKFKSVKRKTIGYLVDNKKPEGITLATDLFDNEKDMMHCAMFIPWGIIREVYELVVVDPDKQ